MKKIMFNDRYGLTQAVLDGRKTQTRRLVPKNIVEGYHDLQIMDKEWEEKGLTTSGFNSFEEFCLYEMRFQNQCYKIGEEVAIAQSYSSIIDDDDLDWIGDAVKKFHAGWNNKMFVKAVYMPHRIKITNVRVERLQDISEEDCLKEGVEYEPSVRGYVVEGMCLSRAKRMLKVFTTTKAAFAALIDKINGKGTWNENPYVFVYDFEIIRRSIDDVDFEE